MTITRTIYSTEEMLGAMREMKELPPFWRRWFPSVHFSQTEKIEWSKIPERRRLAPFVLPTVQGRPVYGDEETLYSVRPAYIKPKDTVNPSSLRSRVAGFGELGQQTPLTPEERYNALVMDIMYEHRKTIERRWEWMCAKALIDGEIVIQNDGYPETTVTFGRDDSLTKTLTGTDQWNTATLDIPGMIDGWLNDMYRLPFGMPGKDLIMGVEAWDAFRKNDDVQKLMNLELRGPVANVDIGSGDGTPYQFRGMLSSNLNLWTYSEWYQAPDGTTTNYLGAKEVVLLASPDQVMGVRAFGSILDAEAQLQPLAIFPKMWLENDPSATVIMCQSAPMPIPINPNATLKATVLE